MQQGIHGGVSRSPAGPLYRTAALVHIALALGTTTFAAVAWWANRTGTVPSMPLPEARGLVYVWLAMLAGGAVAAARIWQTRAEPLDRSIASGRAPAQPPESLLSLLLPVWAVLEAPALFGVVLFLLTGAPAVLAGALLFLWLGFWRTRPRRAWFGLAPAGPIAGAGLGPEA